MKITYKVKLEEWEFYSAIDSEIAGEFDNAGEALDLRDELARNIATDGLVTFSGGSFNSVKVLVERVGDE